MKLSKVCSTKKIFIFNVIICLLSNVALVGLSLILENILDDAQKDMIVLYRVIVFLICLVVDVLLEFLISYYSKKQTMQSTKQMNYYILGRLSKKSMQFYENNSSGDIINKINDIAENVAEYYAYAPFGWVISITNIIAVLGMIIYFNWILAIFVVLIVGILTIFSELISKKIGRLGSEYMTSKKDLNSHVIEMSDNIALIQSLNVNDIFLKDYKNKYEKGRYSKGLKYHLYEAFYYCIYSILNFGLPFLVLFIGFVLENNSLATLSIIIAVFSIVGKMDEPTRIIGTLIAAKKENIEDEKELESILNDISDDTRALVENFSFNKLTFSSKGITTSEQNIILKDFNFDVERGDFVCLCGKSGSGKSTIFKCILNEYTNSENVSVNINEYDVKNYAFCGYITAVYQENYIFHKSVIDNITLGSSFDSELISEVIDTCMLTSFMDKYGNDKMIDNMSSNISGGEKQRICLARTLLRKPQLLLLDEITASLDNETSTKIAENVYNYAKKYNITVICISHKNEFEKYANKKIEI